MRTCTAVLKFYPGGSTGTRTAVLHFYVGSFLGYLGTVQKEGSTDAKMRGLRVGVRLYPCVRERRMRDQLRERT